MKTFCSISILFLLNILFFTSCASRGRPEEGKRRKANIIFEYGLPTRRPKHYPHLLTNFWMTSPCVRFYDVTITNSNDIGYTILELKSIAYYKDGTYPFIFTYDQKKLKQISITNYVEPFDSIITKDRWVLFTESNCFSPAKVVDIYKLLGGNNKIYVIYDTYSIE